MQNPLAMFAHPIRMLSATKLRCKSAFSAIAGDRRGVTAIMLSALLPVMIGFVGLAIDASVWQMGKRNMQGATDRAAYSAAMAGGQSGGTVAKATQQAKATLAQMGYIDGQNGVTVTVLHDVAGIPGVATADLSRAWEVDVTTTQALYFTKIFLRGDPTLHATSVAVNGTSAVVTPVLTYSNVYTYSPVYTPYDVVSTSYPVSVATSTTANDNDSGCILTLATSGTQTTSFTNNASVTSTGCAVYTNSSANGTGSAAALYCNDNCSGSASPWNSSTYTVGNHGGSGTGSWTSTGTPKHKTGQTASADPYASYTAPTAAYLASLTARTASSSATTLSPGYYANGIQSNASTITFSPGTYYFASKFRFANNATVNATGGVTIVLLNGICVGMTSSPGGTCAFETGSYGVTWNIIAPTTSNSTQTLASGLRTPYVGVALYAPGVTGTHKNQEFFAHSILNVQGAIYMPNDIFWVHDNYDTGVFSSSLCVQIVAYKAIFENNANMKASGCPQTGMGQIKTTYNTYATSTTTATVRSTTTATSTSTLTSTGTSTATSYATSTAAAAPGMKF